MTLSAELLQEQTRCIAHESRNQVSICDVYCEIIKKHLIKDGIENDSISRAIECIQTSVKMISNSLIDLKSVNNYSPQNCEISALLLESASLGCVYIHEKEIKINTIVKSDGLVKVDKNKFLACLINLIKNAIEAIDIKGEIILTANVKDKIATISVSNNGKPISQSAQKEIFSEGFTTKKTGSGLGLYICKNNLSAQSADLKLVQSTSKKTEFQITMPVL